MINGGEALAAGIALTIPALVFESSDRVRLVPGLCLAQDWLVVVISMGTMLLWLWPRPRSDASRARVWWFRNPVLGLGEPLGARDLAGGAVEAAGSYMCSAPPDRHPGRRALLEYPA